MNDSLETVHLLYSSFSKFAKSLFDDVIVQTFSLYFGDFFVDFYEDLVNLGNLLYKLLVYIFGLQICINKWFEGDNWIMVLVMLQLAYKAY